MAKRAKAKRSRARSKRMPARPHTRLPRDPRLLSRALLAAGGATEMRRLAREFVSAGRGPAVHVPQNPLALSFRNLRDFKDGVVGTLDGGKLWSEFVHRFWQLLRWREIQFYPADHVPSIGTTPRAKTAPYDADSYVEQAIGLAVGPPPGNPDNEQSIEEGYATFDAGTGKGTAQEYLLNARGALGFGPQITFETDQAANVFLYADLSLDYLFTFDAVPNPKSDPARHGAICFMSGSLWLTCFFDVIDRTTGIGHAGGVPAEHVIRSVALFPENITSGTGAIAPPETYFGIQQQFSALAQPVSYSTRFSLPANSRCILQLALLSDSTAVGPQNGRWNAFLCNTQLNMSASFPMIDIEIWPAT